MLYSNIIHENIIIKKPLSFENLRGGVLSLQVQCWFMLDRCFGYKLKLCHMEHINPKISSTSPVHQPYKFKKISITEDKQGGKVNMFNNSAWSHENLLTCNLLTHHLVLKRLQDGLGKLTKETAAYHECQNSQMTFFRGNLLWRNTEPKL